MSDTEMKVELSNKEYKVAYVNKQLNKVDKISREEAMTSKKEKKNNIDRIGMAIRYKRNLPNISGILRKKKPLLKKTDRLRTIFTSLSNVACRR